MNSWSESLHRGDRLVAQAQKIDPDVLLFPGMEIALVGFVEADGVVRVIYDRGLVISQLLGQGFGLYNIFDMLRDWTSPCGPYGGHGAPLAEQDGERCPW